MFSTPEIPWVHGVPASSPEYFWEAKMSGKIKWTRRLGSHLGNQSILWIFNEMSTVWSWSCFRDSPGTPGTWSQTRKWVKTHGKTMCFFGHQTLKHSVLENHRLFLDFLNMVMLCLDDPLYQPTVERPTRSTDITRDELVAPVPWSGESSDVGDIPRIENDSWAKLEFSEWPMNGFFCG